MPFIWKQDVRGKVKNTQLGKSRALLPLFETVVNSFQAIEESGSPSTQHHIDIVIERERVLEGFEEPGRPRHVTVIDDGVGFTDENLLSFFTSDTQHKSEKGGKGIGRFIWLKAFDHAEIESHFRDGDELLVRRFVFTIRGEEQEAIPEASPLQSPQTLVRLVDMKPEYQEHCPKHLEHIGHLLVEHTIPFFLNPDCPTVTLRDEQEGADLNEYFHDAFVSQATPHTFAVKGQAFTITGLRLTHPHETTTHRLIYAGNFREVRSEKLERFIPNLRQRRLEDRETKFAYLGFVQGVYLDDHLNNERTEFTFADDADSADMLSDGITLADIRSGAVDVVRTELAPYLEEINQDKAERIKTAVAEMPEYRALARYVPEFIDKIPPNPSAKELELALHEQLFEKQRALRHEARELIDASDKQALLPDDYEARVNDFLDRANELGKSSLARYVTHRRVMLDFLERSLRVNPATGKHELENVVHRIIYPMRATSDQVPYEQQNLWIIDERLTFHGFLSSDTPLKDLNTIANNSKSRPDIMIFDRPLSFVEGGEDVLNSLVVIEFKRPDKPSFSKGDPVDQAMRMIQEIKTGHFYGPGHRQIKVASANIPAYAYVICDLTEEINLLCDRKGMTPTPDRLGWFQFVPGLQAYVEVISYDKLLRDAKKRNRVLFEKLNLPTSISINKP